MAKKVNIKNPGEVFVPQDLRTYSKRMRDAEEIQRRERESNRKRMDAQRANGII